MTAPKLMHEKTKMKNSDLTTGFVSGPPTPVPTVKMREHIASLEATEAHSTEPQKPGGLKALDTPILFALAIFVLALAAMIVGLEVLKHFSDSQQGVAFVSQDQHSLWTYGPTLILTIATTYWCRVKYHETQRLPWKLLSQGPTTAENSLLLDYHTPLNVISLLRSAQARHFSITLAILGEICLRILVVISTGLFKPELRDFPRDTTVRLLDQFNLTRLGDGLSLVDPTMSIWAETKRDLPAPSWLTAQGGAIQSFVAIEGPGVNITAKVAVFEVNQHCQTFSWKPRHESTAFRKVSDVAPPEDLQILSQLCSTSSENSLYQTAVRNPPVSLTSFEISRNHGMSLTAFEACPNFTQRVDSHGIFVTFFLDHDQDANITSLLCTQSYSIKTREVTTEWATVSPGNVLSVSNTFSDDIQLGLPDINITNIILGAVGQSLDEDDVFGTFNTRWWLLMNYTSQWGSRHGSEFWKATYLAELLGKTFANVASRVIKIDGVSSSHDSCGAKMDYKVLRLMVEEQPVRIMEALLSLSALTAIALMAIQRRFYSKCNSSLISLAVTLSRSHDLANQLAARGRHTIESLTATMKGFVFSLAADGEILAKKSTTEVLSAEPPKRTRAKDNRDNTKDDTGASWHPFALRLPFATIVFGLSAAIIAALESMYQYSRAHTGIADVSVEGYMKIWWCYPPTALLVLVGLAYSSISFSLRTIHPYQELWKQRPNNAYAMRLDPFAKFELFLLPRFIKSRFYPLAAAVLIQLLSPLLPIISSGLYTVQKTTATDSIELHVDGWIDLGGPSQQYPSPEKNATTAASVINEAIQYHNLSFPEWTYDEFTFASIDLSRLQNLSLGLYVGVQARLPAVRAQANCSVLDDGYGRPYNTLELGNLTIRTRPPPGCRPPSNLPLTGSDDARLVLSYNTAIPTTNTFLPVLHSSPFGLSALPSWYIPGHQSGQPNKQSTSPTEEYIPSQPTTVCNDGGLQHIFFLYGHGTATQLENLTILHCMPYVEALYVETKLSMDTTLNPPHVKINDRGPDGEASPPREVPGSARLWEGTENHTGYYPMEFPHMHMRRAGDVESTHHDWFFLSLSTAYQGVPETELTAPDNTNIMLKRIRHLYAQLTAQYMNYASRRSRSHIIESGLPNATVSTEPYRLVQNEVSTRILEVLLFALLLCGMVITWMVPTKELQLPLAPSSIAARMSLIAGSELVERLKRSRNGDLGGPEGDSMFKDESFALHWWDSTSPASASNGSRHNGGSRYGIDMVPSVGSL
ncbi:hypothetical protein B0H66DRAFT_594509 [Apodospora peruviana]|uniref:Uncharacterized protein n=1 Tax=Apodospora peruviana TaxID=516989 RepID=A0AAE0LZR4_9PEZI|nr:hypothetical protein B0H66DRAFT_594509 [Apodospora peruviana]